MLKGIIGICDNLEIDIEKERKEFDQAFQELRETTGGPSLTYCPCCNRLDECTHEFEGKLYCSDECVKEMMIMVNQVSTLCQYTGLNMEEIKNTMVTNHWTFDDFAQHVDTYNSALSQGASVPPAIITAFENADIFNKLSSNLTSYNTMRGGVNGFKGFVFEELHAVNATISGTPTTVLSNNGVADFLIVKTDGTRVLGQAKAGYGNTYIDFSKYQNQTLVVDSGNTQLIQRAKSAGLEVIESEVSLKQSTRLADIMRLESNILGTSNAKITSKLYSLNQAGLASAKTGGVVGAGFSIGSNIVEVFSGDRDLSEAGVAVVRDTAIATASSYAIGALASTSVGTAVTGAVGTAATTAGAAFASTAVGSTVVTGAGAIAGVATAATTAATGMATGAITTVATAAAGTAIGGTAVGGAAIAGAAVVGTAAVAAAPFVLGAAAIGGAFAIGKKLFGKR